MRCQRNTTQLVTSLSLPDVLQWLGQSARRTSLSGILHILVTIRSCMMYLLIHVAPPSDTSCTCTYLSSVTPSATLHTDELLPLKANGVVQQHLPGNMTLLWSNSWQIVQKTCNTPNVDTKMPQCLARVRDFFSVALRK